MYYRFLLLFPLRVFDSRSKQKATKQKKAVLHHRTRDRAKSTSHFHLGISKHDFVANIAAADFFEDRAGRLS